MTSQEYLLLVWVTLTSLGVVGLSGALLWAIRSGQFRNQDRARYLPLESRIPSDSEWKEFMDGRGKNHA